MERLRKWNTRYGYAREGPTYAVLDGHLLMGSGVTPGEAWTDARATAEKAGVTLSDGAECVDISGCRCE